MNANVSQAAEADRPVESRLGDDGVLTITLCDEANRNALSEAVRAALAQAIARADADPAVRVVVLTNRGRTFCAGADLKQKSAAPADGAAPPVPGMSELLLRIRRSPKPFVGRIVGHCVAGGIGLAAAMDIAVAAEDAGFGFTEVRLGVAPAIISVVCLPKMRTAEAREAFLRGHRFDAREAQRMGLINHAVPRDAVDAVVADVVRDLLAGGPLAIAATKQLLEQVPQLGLAEGLAWAAPLSARLFDSNEGREGIAAYREKRAAAWTRREP